MKYILIILILAAETFAQGQGLHKYKIGDTAFCGIVFFVQDIDSFGRQHGLVFALADQSAGIAWFNGSYPTTFAIQDHYYAKGNADTIINVQRKQVNYAALVANNFIKDSLCTNWYLPSRTELLALYTNIARNKNAAIKKSGQFKNEGYWSSLESRPASANNLPANERRAYIVDFLNGRIFAVNKANKYRVRAVREFRNATINGQ